MKGRRWKKSKSSILFFIPVKKMIDRSFAFDGGERNGEDNKKKRRKEGEEKESRGRKKVSLSRLSFNPASHGFSF